MSDALATQEDVEAIIGRDLSDAEEARVEAVLLKLSELFRAESRQDFTPGESHVELNVNAGRVLLEQRPVIEVLEVTDPDGTPIEDWSVFHQRLTVPRRSHQMVRVRYTHGAVEVPALVVTTIADAARQILQIAPEAVAGRAQEGDTAGPYTQSASYATWAQGGATRLSPEDRAIARGFRVKSGKTWVAQP